MLWIVCCKRSLALVDWFNIRILCLESHVLSYICKVVLKHAVISLENRWHEKSFFGLTLPGHKIILNPHVFFPCKQFLSYLDPTAVST